MIDIKALSSWDFELARVESEQLEDCRVDVRHIVAILDGVEANFVGRTVDDTLF